MSLLSRRGAITLTKCGTESDSLSILGQPKNIILLMMKAKTRSTPSQWLQAKSSLDFIYRELQVDVKLGYLEPFQDQLSAASALTCLRLMGRAKT